MKRLGLPRVAVALVICILAFAASLAFAREASPGKDPLGTKPPEWDVTHWINSSALQLKSLQGKVVLIRWWTAPHCSFCAASAPALNELDRLYRDKGLVVIGFYHHKSPHPLNLDEVESFTRQFGFQFPVAIDPEWRTLKRWWLDGRERAWTSVSFLIDRQGIIRHIHPGGSYAMGSDDYAQLKAKVEELLGKDSQ
jgi:glutathione peroxidase-family protein